jgi:hypothetical protein
MPNFNAGWVIKMCHRPTATTDHLRDAPRWQSLQNASRCLNKKVVKLEGFLVIETVPSYWATSLLPLLASAAQATCDRMNEGARA